MRRFFLLLLLFCLLIPLLAGCGGEPEEIILAPLDPAATPTLTHSERSVRVRTPFGPAVTAALPSPQASETPAPNAAEEQDILNAHYVLNTNSKRFHLPSCSSVSDIKASNREDFTGSRDELLSMGYKPCGRCNP